MLGKQSRDTSAFQPLPQPLHKMERGKESLTPSPFVEWREGKKASPPALCFPRFAGFTNSDLWFPEEGGE